MYTSSLFTKSRAWAEQYGRQWKILSAKHGIIGPADVIDPYDTTLSSRDPEWDARVIEALAQPKPKTIAVLAGQRYCNWIPEYTQKTGAKVHQPLTGLQIGQRLAFLKAQTRA